VKARVFSDVAPAGRYWVYEVRDLARLEGHQVVITGTRLSQPDALASACDFLKRVTQL
jgi:hypothetical protein